MDHAKFRVKPGSKVSLGDFDPAYTGKFRDKSDAGTALTEDVSQLARYQDILYAQDVHALLIILQGMDGAGKDSVVKHVLSGVNPQGCQVYSFKTPTAEELDHDYLWRCAKALPRRGQIGIFNRSYYEEVLVVRVHPEMLAAQRLPGDEKQGEIWKKRFEDINCFERHLVRNGTTVLKFYLHLSRQEQKKRFLERLETPEKNWKFSLDDTRERSLWDKYMNAYEDLFSHTSTLWAPWYIIPADHKWFTRTAVADIVIGALRSLDLKYPKPGRDHARELRDAIRELQKED